MMKPARRATRKVLAASLALALALPLAPGEVEARSVLGRVWDLVTAPGADAKGKVKAPAEGAGTKGTSATDSTVRDGAATDADRDGAGAEGGAAKGKDADNAMDGATDGDTTSRWPQKLQAEHGQTVEFPHSHVKGRLGDRLTALRLAGRGYKKLKSKYDDLHGFDGVYVKKNAAGEIVEIRLVESKVDSSRLIPGPPPQMSDEWIRQVCAKMQEQGNPELTETARLILDNMNSPKLKRELWHHDLAKGKTTVRQVDAGGKPGAVTEGWEDKLVANEIARQCGVALLVCN
ncbi:MAG: hypothetical protein NHG36_01100 [Chromatiaceae bacterium]|nr:hypothetical protein [Candidatus Thioaporhodococcus sediminis]